jgi:hypothetical protein
MHERLSDQPHAVLHDRFHVFLTGDRREELTSIDDVLELENSRKHRITRLVATSTASTAGAPRPEHEIQVDFEGPKAIITNEADKTARVVAISIRSDQRAWASRALSEVEEQLERTVQYTRKPVLALVGLLAAMLILFVAQLPSIHVKPTLEEVGPTMWLQESDLDRIEAIVRQQRPITDQELREVVTMQLRNVLNAQRPGRPARKSNTRQLLVIAIPLTVVASCIIALLSTCYPKAVFLWGDEVERYASTLQRRRILWGVVVAITLVGLLSRLLFEGVAAWLPDSSP